MLDVHDEAGNSDSKKLTVSLKGTQEPAPTITQSRIYTCPNNPKKFCVRIATSGQSITKATLFVEGKTTIPYLIYNLLCPNGKDCEGEFDLPTSVHGGVRDFKFVVVAENGLVSETVIPLKNVPVFATLPKEQPIRAERLQIDGQSPQPRGKTAPAVHKALSQ